MITLKGNAVSPGAARGAVYIYRPFQAVAEEKHLDAEAAPAEKARYLAVKEKAGAELAALCSALEKEDPEKAKIFTAHLDILNDPAMGEEIIEEIESEKGAGDWAIWKVYAKFIKMISRAKDPMIQERTVDFEDVRKRLLRIWNGAAETGLSRLPSPVVVAARDLMPSDTASIDRRNVLAIITETGGATSHSAIIARSYEIPAILGIAGLLDALKDGMTVAVDALSGALFLDPDNETAARIDLLREAWLREAAVTKTFLQKEGRTASGERVEIGLNIGSAGEEELTGAAYTDYAGLFRTEFLYLGRDNLPSEDEQFEVYRTVLSLYGARPVTLRTLDIGGDKQLSCMNLPAEDNPFLGKRALRLCFDYPALFKTQLRAALRASVYGNLYLMLPMVGSLDDIRRAKTILKEVEAELTAEGKPYRADYKLGIMIEIPAIALVADLAAAEVDFASVGTNDLCQYLCAVDRMNPEIASYYQSYHPAMFRIIGMAASAFAQAGKPLSVCGEMGGNPPSALALVGLGVRKLSMGLAQVAQVKRLLAGLRLCEAEAAARQVQRFSTAAEAESFLREKEELCTKKQ